MVQLKISSPSKNNINLYYKENVNELPARVQEVITDPGALNVTYMIAPAGINLYVCLGEEAKVKNNTYRQAAAKSYKQAKDLKLKDVNLNVENASEEVVLAIVEGILIQSYEFLAYKKEPNPTEMTVNFNVDKKYQILLDNALKVNDKVSIARDLVNKGNYDVNTLTVCETVLDLAKKYNLKATIIDDKELEALGMGLICAVGRGGATPPRVAIIEYKGNPKSKDVYALVGKGMVYDTGGLNIKPTGAMETMRSDMAGSVTVLATTLALADLKVPVNVTCFMALADNGVDAMSYKPGDTFQAYNGKYVEIGNTDAEGRLVLADTVAYAVDKYKPVQLIDVATLTGACMIALGHNTAGLMTNNSEMVQKLLENSRKTDESMWELPMLEEFSEAMKGQFSDLKNISSEKYGGAMTGAAFIKEFVGNTEWTHIDIAGPSFMDKPTQYYDYGATGFGVRTLVQYFESL